jgi:hypothetical protein
MRSALISAICITLYSPVQASSDKSYVCAIEKSRFNKSLKKEKSVLKFVLLVNEDKNYDLKENVSLKNDSLCKVNHFSDGDTEIICLGSRFYFSLYKNELIATISYWADEVTNEKFNPIIGADGKIGIESVVEKELRHFSRTGSCDAF